jgi:hypothetical protein
MAIKGAEKIIEALTQLMDGYCELQEAIERDFGGRGDKPEDAAATELSSEVDAALVTEIRAAIETVMEEEDYSAEEIASVISILTDSLEEIDPDVFEAEGTASAADDDDEDYAEYDEDEDDAEEDEDDDDDEEE